MNVCPKCGKEINSENGICPTCGLLIHIEKPEFEYISEKAYGPVFRNSKRSSKKTTKKPSGRLKKMVLAVGVLLIVLVIVCVCLLSSRKEDEPPLNAYVYLKEDGLYYTNMTDHETKLIDDQINITDGKSDDNMYGYATSIMYNMMLSENGKVVVYSRDSIYGGKEFQPLYYCKCTAAELKPSFIDAQVVRYTMNKKGTLITYQSKVQDTLYQLNVDQDKITKIDDEVNTFLVSEDGKRIFYVKNDDLYLKRSGKKAELIDEGIEKTNYITIDYSTIYYIKDYILYKKTIGQEKIQIATNVTELTIVYESGEIYYKIAPEESIAKLESCEKELQDNYGIHVSIIERLCYYDGEQHILSDDANVTNMYGNPTKPIISYEIQDDSLKNGQETYLAIQSEVVKIDCNTFCKYLFGNESGTTFYYLDDCYDYSDDIGNLYVIKMEDGMVGKAEIYDEDVCAMNMFTTTSDDIIYFKNVDSDTYRGDMYKNHELIDQNVSLFYSNIIKDSLIYMKDMDTNVEGTLCIYKNGQSTPLHNNVERYYVRPDDSIMFLSDVQDNKGDLYQYQNNESIVIDQDVIAGKAANYYRYVNFGYWDRYSRLYE